jgi:hypothetical protein
MISDLFKLRQVLFGLVELRPICNRGSHHGDTLKLCTGVQLYISTAWIRVVSSDYWHIASPLHHRVARIILLFLTFLIWHKDGWQLGLYEIREYFELTKLLPVRP